MTEIEPDSEHSERGPSTAHRWLACPGSVRLSRGIPNEAGIEAAYGTVFHEFAAFCVQHGLDPQGFVGATMVVEPHGVIEFDQEMADYMQNGLDLIESLLDEQTRLVVEKQVSLSEWIGPGEFGTTDVTIVDLQNWRITCFDWKYGAGVPVSPVRNEQAMLYVLGAWSEFARDLFQQAVFDRDPSGATEASAPWAEDIEVQIIIEQPRAPGGGGVWKTSMGYLLEEGRRIREGARLTEEPDAPFVPGEKQCKFCPAARENVCRTRAEHLLSLAHIDLDLIEMVPEAPLDLPKAITPEARSRILLHREQIKQYLDDLHAEAYHDYEAGREVPWLKMVEGRKPPRQWRDPAKAEMILRRRLGEEAFHDPKMLSPAEVQKTVGKRTYREHIHRHVDEGEAKQILVPEDDPRVPIKNSLDYLPDPDNDTLV